MMLEKVTIWLMLEKEMILFKVKKGTTHFWEVLKLKFKLSWMKKENKSLMKMVSPFLQILFSPTISAVIL